MTDLLFSGQHWYNLCGAPGEMKVEYAADGSRVLVEDGVFIPYIDRRDAQGYSRMLYSQQ